MATQVVAGAAGAAPTSFEVAGLDNAVPVVISAEWDGSGAGGDFHPCVSIYSDDGRLMSRTGVEITLAAGDTAEVTYAPFLKTSLRGFLRWGTNTDPTGLGLTLNGTGGAFITNTSSGGWELDTGSGNIDIDTDGGDYKLETDGGTVFLCWFGSTPVDFNIDTSGGAWYCDMDSGDVTWAMDNSEYKIGVASLFQVALNNGGTVVFRDHNNNPIQTWTG